MGNLKKESERIEFLGVEAKTKKGNPAKLDGEPVLVIPEGLEMIEDGGKKYLQAKDDAVAGPVVFAVDADGDLGEGVKPLHFEAAINIMDAEAETLELKLGPVEARP